MLKCVEDFRVYMTIWIIYEYIIQYTCMYSIHIYHGLLKCFLGQSQRTNGIWFPWFEFDLPPVAQGGLHVHAGEEHGG